MWLEEDEDVAEWVPELHQSPEYHLFQHYPPLFWTKRDTDDFHRAIEEMMR
jgi:hypothetical protein